MTVSSAISVSVLGGWPAEERRLRAARSNRLSVKFNRRYFKRVHLYARSRIVRAREQSIPAAW